MNQLRQRGYTWRVEGELTSAQLGQKAASPDRRFYRELAARYRAYVYDVPKDAFPTFLEAQHFEFW